MTEQEIEQLEVILKMKGDCIDYECHSCPIQALSPCYSNKIRIKRAKKLLINYATEKMLEQN